MYWRYYENSICFVIFIRLYGFGFGLLFSYYSDVLNKFGVIGRDRFEMLKI